MYKISRACTALCVSFALAFSAAGTGLCAEVKTAQAANETQSGDTVEKIVSNSVICYQNMNRLLDLGRLSVIDPAANESMTIGGTYYCELGWIEEHLGVTYKWDGSKNSIIITDGKDECAVVCASLEDIDGDGANGFFLGEYTYIPLKSFCEKMGWSTYFGSDFRIVSKTLNLDELVTKDSEDKILDKGKTVLGEYDFEDEKPEITLGLWDGAVAEMFTVPNKIVTEGDNSFLQIGASQSSYGGAYVPPIKFERDSVIEFSFDAIKSDDFAGASFTFLIQSFKNGYFQKYIDGIYQSPDKGTWKHYTKKLDTSLIPSDADEIRIVFCTRCNPSLGEPSGRIMVDNVRIVSTPVIRDTAVTPSIKADKLGNWYILGDTVTMTPQNKLDTDVYKDVFIEIYDSWNNIVHTESVSVSAFNGGYKWKPEKQGFYEYKFYTVDKNGQKAELNDFYSVKNPKTLENVRVYLKRQGIVVARYETKPMSERSDRLCVSMEAGRYLNPDIANGRTKGLQGDQIDVANLLGFKKIRFHWFSPDGLAYKTQSKANTKRGDFDFAEWDASVNDARKLGFDLVINIMGTPRYVAPYRTGYDSPTGKNITYYAPVDIEGWRAFVDYAVNRYKDDCHIWEIWNEPHVFGGSVFWQGITKDFAEIQKAGYEAVKKYQPGDKSRVILGGIGARRYTNFYEELVQTDAYDAYDLLAMHGWDVDPWNYNKIAEDYGKEPKPICSTELHMMLRSSDSEYLNNTEKEEAMRMVVEFLKDFKYGSEFTTFFAVNVSHNIEWLKYLNENKIYGQGMDGGAYKVGVFQPRFAAMAMNTFFDTVGKQYDYVDEYLLANKKQNVVRVNSNGKDRLIVWNVGGSKSNTTVLSKLITDCAADGFKIIDWENNDIDTSDLNNIEIKPETMYFISGLDSEKLNSIPSDKGEQVYTGDVLYNITEKQKNDVTRNLTHVVTNGSTEPLFDKTTFALADGIEYTSDNEKWIARRDGAQRGNFDMKHAVSVADDGMYIVAKVHDEDDNAGSAPDEMSTKDSIAFAFDTVGDRSDNGYMECVAGLNADGTPTVYKKTAPYIGGDIISDFTPGGSVIKDAVFSRTTDGAETTYMIYLPTKEIYPYERNTNEALHFSVMANQNDGTGICGSLAWGGGLDGGKPMKFGDVWLDAEVAKTNDVYYPHLALAVNKPLFDKETLEYADGINWIDDNLNWVSLNEGAQQGTFAAKFAVGVTDEGVYLAAEVTDDNINNEAKNKGGLWSVDSMQFAIDVGMKGSSDDRIECQFGKIIGGQTALYKEAAPFITAEKAPEGYTQKQSLIEGGVKDVTVSDGKIIYKAFIPSAEIYPFSIADSDVLKLSVLFNQHDGTGRIGYLEWNSGIGGGKNPKQYGIISYK